MGDKSVRKKQFIVDKAKEVFTEKGYRAVTMKDIVDACDISRGGLYLYFESTRQVFMEVLKSEQEGEDVFSGKVSENSTSAEILVLFLVEQKKEILRKRGSLTKAIYEFYFEEKPDRKDDFLRKEADATVKILKRVIELGVENGELVCADPSEAAKSILYTLEGLKALSNTVGISSEAIDRQFIYILSTLGIEDDGN
jgi:AcrR family transcriptional regulator